MDPHFNDFGIDMRSGVGDDCIALLRKEIGKPARAKRPVGLDTLIDGKARRPGNVRRRKLLETIDILPKPDRVEGDE